MVQNWDGLKNEIDKLAAVYAACSDTERKEMRDSFYDTHSLANNCKLSECYLAGRLNELGDRARFYRTNMKCANFFAKFGILFSRVNTKRNNCVSIRARTIYYED